jgi:hypothetical protein
MIVHVVDCYTIGDPSALQNIQQEIEVHGLSVKVSQITTDYLSCNFKINRNNTMAWIGQTTLLRKLIA